MSVLALDLPASIAPTSLDVGHERVNYYASKARSDATALAYEKDFAAFIAWCGLGAFEPLPAEPETVARYVVDLADSGRAVATITRHLASISVAHKRARLESPTSHVGVTETMKGVRRRLGVAQRKKAPLVIEDLRRVVAPLGTSPADVRDRALLVLGFAAAFRRSELVALDVADLAFVRSGLEVTVRSSKTDQEGAGELVAVPYGSNLATCPVRALQAWLEVSAIATGPVFRPFAKGGRAFERRLCGRAVALIVKARAAAVGLEGDLSGHSLRAGFATSAANAGVSLHDSMRQTRHKSEHVARGYIRRATAWEKNAAASVGL